VTHAMVEVKQKKSWDFWEGVPKILDFAKL
jgi:hypothetical protein